MEKYIASLTALNDLTIAESKSGKISDIKRYAESDIFWAKNKENSIPNRKIIKGNIYQFEFGKNFIPEMSYEHRGLVIGGSGKLLYVLPICSYNNKIIEHQNAYHPIEKPENVKSNYYLLKASEFAFLKHDSVLKLNDIRTVSFLRIKYKQEHGKIDPESDTYAKIEELVLSKYFYGFVYSKERLMVQKEELANQIEQLTKENDDIKRKISEIWLTALDSDDWNIKALLKEKFDFLDNP